MRTFLARDGVHAAHWCEVIDGSTNRVNDAHLACTSVYLVNFSTANLGLVAAFSNELSRRAPARGGIPPSTEIAKLLISQSKVHPHAAALEHHPGRVHVRALEPTLREHGSVSKRDAAAGNTVIANATFAQEH